MVVEGNWIRALLVVEGHVILVDVEESEGTSGIAHSGSKSDVIEPNGLGKTGVLFTRHGLSWGRA
jgi:hypothetical protein